MLPGEPEHPGDLRCSIGCSSNPSALLPPSWNRQRLFHTLHRDDQGCAQAEFQPKVYGWQRVEKKFLVKPGYATED
jgi:hypothetical protein